MSKFFKCITYIGFLFLILSFTGCGKSLCLNDYIEYSVDGYDRYAKLKCSFDWDWLEADLVELYKVDIDTPKGQRTIETITDSIDYSFNLSDGISNGDSLELKWEIDKASLEKHDIKLKFAGQDVCEEISGLPQIGKINVFEGVEVNFGGVLPYAAINCDLKNAKYGKLNFKITNLEDAPFRNGDILKIQCTSPTGDLNQYCVNAYDAEPETDCMEYVIENKECYIATISDVSKEDIDKMTELAMSTHKEMVDTFYAEPEKFSTEYYGAFYVYPKDTTNYYPNTNVGVVLTVNSETLDEPYFYYMRFDTPVVKEDGTIKVDMNSAKPCGYISGFTWFNTSNGEKFSKDGKSYIGIENLDKIKEYYSSNGQFTIKYEMEKTY